MFMDRLTVDSPRRDATGNLVASVLAARVGVQDYAGYEVGKPELASVAVYRPESEVFSVDSMRSFAGAPVTIEHPATAVTPATWKDVAVGESDQEIVRDGQAVRVPFMLRDAAGIAAVEAGKREISMGYEAQLVWGDGVAPDGTPYQATQTNIRINHLAIVDKARGGPSLRIGDSEMTTKTITFDGLPLLVTDAAEAAIGKLQAQIADGATKLATAETKVATLTTDMANREAEIVTLKASLVDAKVTPAQMRDAAKAYALVVDKAKAFGVTVTDAMDESAIKKAVVTLKVGDASATWTDAQIDASFGTLAVATPVNDAFATAMSAGVVNIGDAAAREKAAMAKANDFNAWRNASAA